MKFKTMEITAILFTMTLFGKLGANYTEADLHRHLFKNYLTDVKPHFDKTTPLEVTVQMFLMSVDTIDEKRQTITIRAFLEIKWKDDNLVWDEDTYTNISVITVKDSSIWLPDLALLDTFGKPTDLGLGGQAVISSDGLVTVWPYKMYTVSCKIGIAKFPFDKQTCKFDFASWTTNNKIMALKTVSDTIPLRYLMESGEWGLVNTRIELVPVTYGRDDYDHVYFILELQRKALFHIMNLMIPVLCISLLNVTSFLLPSEDGERVTLSISVFLTLAVFLTVVNSAMPETSDEVALFTIYVGMQLFGSVMTVALTVTSLAVFHIDEEHDVPKQMKLFVRMCCVRKKKVDQTEKPPSDVKSNPTPNLQDILSFRVKASNELYRVTWKMVSRAIDKFCAMCAVFWNLLLFASVLASMTQ